MTSVGQPSPDRVRRRWAILWPAIMVFLTAGYFINTRPGWNVNSQFALTVAIAERATLAIDAYHELPGMGTGDKAFFNGHYYCDKPPVTALLGVPSYWLFRSASSLVGRFSTAIARWWTTWWTSGLAAAALAGLLGWAFVRRDVPPRRAAWLAALWIVATPLLGYSILFMSYLPACAMALGGWLLLERVGRSCPHPKPVRLVGSGALLGLAAWTLPTVGLVAVVAAGMLALNARPWTAAARHLALWTLGALIGYGGSFVYNYHLFHAFNMPYAYEANAFFREQMSKGLMGATRPRLLVAWLLTFHPFMGLFLWFPVTLLALAGCMRQAFRRNGDRLQYLGALVILAGLLVYTSAYFMWWGGWAYAPRHLIPSLPFLALGLAAWLSARGRLPFAAVWLVAAAGAVMNIAAVALDPQISPGIAQELLLAPARVERWTSPFLELQTRFWRYGQTDVNWGTLAGLRGQASLLPLLAMWVAGGLILQRLTKPQANNMAHSTGGTGQG